MVLLEPEGHLLDDIQYSNVNVSDKNYSEYVNVWEVLETHEIVLKALVLVPIVVLGLLGNMSIIVVVARIRGMRTCTNMFICNMALADLMTILFCSWTIVVVDAHQNFVLGETYCKLDGFLQVTFLLASVFSLIIISGDRLLGIVFPFSQRLDKSHAGVIVAFIWLTAMVCACPPYLSRWLMRRRWNDIVEVWCNEDITLLKYYWLIMLLLLVYAPLTVMAVAYTAIILQLDKYEHQLFLREHPLKMKYRKKVIKVLFMYVINYLVCWMFFQVYVFYRYFKKPQDKLDDWTRPVYFVAHVLTYTQSAINPVIYGARNESFRRAFRIAFRDSRLRRLCLRCRWRRNRVAPAPPPPEQVFAQPQPARKPDFALPEYAVQGNKGTTPSTKETDLRNSLVHLNNHEVSNNQSTSDTKEHSRALKQLWIAQRHRTLQNIPDHLNNHRVSNDIRY